MCNWKLGRGKIWKNNIQKCSAKFDENDKPTDTRSSTNTMFKKQRKLKLQEITEINFLKSRDKGKKS